MDLQDLEFEEDMLIKEESLSNESWGDAGSVQATSAYRPVTVLTNLQRGNIQTEENGPEPQQMTWHTRAAMGEITHQDCQLASTGSGGIDTQDKEGLSALCWAASYGQVLATRLLLGCGAGLEHEGVDGNTALQLACCKGHSDVVRVLLQAGADVDHADDMACTPLMFAAGADAPHCVTELLEAGADISATNFAGDNAYAIACRRGSKYAIAALDRYMQKLLSSCLRE